MAFYSPNFLSPVNTEILSATPNTFTWQNNFGTSPQVKYNLHVHKILDNTQVYTSTLTTSATAQHTIPSGSLIAGTDYKWSVDSYYDSINYVSSDWQIIYARGNPTCTLSSTPYNQQSFEFNFLYDHPNSVYCKNYRVYLYEGSTIIDDSDDIYPDTLIATAATPISYTVEGMLSGHSYSVQCVVTTQENLEIDSGLINFTVTYDYLTALPSLTVTPLNDEAAIQLDWVNLVQILGSVIGEYEFLGSTNKYIHLEPDTTLTYSSGITIPELFTQIFKIQLPTGFTGDFIRYDNNYKIGYNGTKFYYQRGYRITAGLPQTLPSGWFTVVVLPKKIIIISDTYTETLI
jgi:hypothetical protein